MVFFPIFFFGTVRKDGGSSQVGVGRASRTAGDFGVDIGGLCRGSGEERPGRDESPVLFSTQTVFFFSTVCVHVT